jgi:hypothetical protein
MEDLKLMVVDDGAGGGVGSKLSAGVARAVEDARAAAAARDPALFTPFFRELPPPPGPHAPFQRPAGDFIKLSYVVPGNTYDADGEDAAFVARVNAGGVTPREALCFPFTAPPARGSGSGRGGGGSGTASDASPTAGAHGSGKAARRREPASSAAASSGKAAPHAVLDVSGLERCFEALETEAYLTGVVAARAEAARAVAAGRDAMRANVSQLLREYQALVERHSTTTTTTRGGGGGGGAGGGVHPATGAVSSDGSGGPAAAALAAAAAADGSASKPPTPKGRTAGVKRARAAAGDGDSGGPGDTRAAGSAGDLADPASVAQALQPVDAAAADAAARLVALLPPAAATAALQEALTPAPSTTATAASPSSSSSAAAASAPSAAAVLLPPPPVVAAVYWYWVGKRCSADGGGGAPLLRCFQTLGQADVPPDLDWAQLCALIGGTAQLTPTDVQLRDRSIARLKYRLKQLKQAHPGNRALSVQYSALCAAIAKGGALEIMSVASAAAAAASAATGQAYDDDDGDDGSSDGGGGDDDEDGGSGSGSRSAAASSSAAPASSPTSAASSAGGASSSSSSWRWRRGRSSRPSR